MARGRSETALERCDRNLVELLQEVRVVQTGVEVLSRLHRTVRTLVMAGAPTRSTAPTGDDAIDALLA